MFIYCKMCEAANKDTASECIACGSPLTSESTWTKKPKTPDKPKTTAPPTMKSRIVSAMARRRENAASARLRRAILREKERQRIQSDQPTYFALFVIGAFLRWVGLLSIVIGILMGIEVAFGIGAGYGLSVAAVIAFSGIYTMGAGEVLFCLRDIAINSFRLTDILEREEKDDA